MSYLTLSRLHFFGRFFANPSTVNNDPCHFDPSNPIQDPSWNPKGNHYFQLRNCSIQTLIRADGSVVAQPGTTEPLLGAPVASTDQYAGARSPAKLVDLDSEQQMVSMIFGLQLKIGLSDSNYVIGNFRPVPFGDLFQRVISGQGDSSLSAYYQSVLDVVSWSSNITSPFLSALRQASPTLLSIKFVVDGYNTDNSSAQFASGRVTGTIGPASASEPINFLNARFLRPPADGSSDLNFAPCLVDVPRSRLVIDLGNSIPSVSTDGPPPDLGSLQAAILPTGAQPIILGQLDYSLNAYRSTAGIQELPLSAQQLARVAETPLGILQNGANILLAENSTGAYINATPYVYRMNPGDSQLVTLIANRFGKPAGGQTIQLSLDTSGLQPAQNCTVPVGIPANSLNFPPAVATDADGHASFILSAASPGNPRKFIDGQVYGIRFTWDQDVNADPGFFISVLAHDGVSIPASPTWWADVEPILRQYSRLYPYMDGLLKLDDYSAIRQAAPRIAQLLSLPIEDPRYMPVTRDLSRDKTAIILKWIADGVPEGEKTRP
jgi:hypothetical protein